MRNPSDPRDNRTFSHQKRRGHTPSHTYGSANRVLPTHYHDGSNSYDHGNHALADYYTSTTYSREGYRQMSSSDEIKKLKDELRVSCKALNNSKKNLHLTYGISTGSVCLNFVLIVVLITQGLHRSTDTVEEFPIPQFNLPAKVKLDGVFTDDLNDPTTEKYQQLQSQACNNIQKIIGLDSFLDMFDVNCEVTKMSPGSIKMDILFNIVLNIEALVEQIVSRPVQQNGASDMLINYILLNEGSDTSICDSNPCENNGWCYLRSQDHYDCICPKGFSGTRCEISAPLGLNITTPSNAVTPTYTTSQTLCPVCQVCPTCVHDQTQCPTCSQCAECASCSAFPTQTSVICPTSLIETVAISTCVPSYITSCEPSYITSYEPSYITSCEPSYITSYEPSYITSCEPSYINSCESSYLPSGNTSTNIQPETTITEIITTSDQSSGDSEIPSSESSCESEITSGESEITSDQPEITNSQSEVTSDQPEITSSRSEVTSDQPEITNSQSEVTSNQPSGQSEITSDQSNGQSETLSQISTMSVFVSSTSEEQSSPESSSSIVIPDGMLEEITLPSGKKYWFKLEKKTYQDASDLCKLYNLKVVEFENDAELATLYTYLQGSQPDLYSGYFWVAATRESAQDPFTWESDDSTVHDSLDLETKFTGLCAYAYYLELDSTHCTATQDTVCE